MKKEILKLRNAGKTYNEIRAILGCSKSTISYHCGAGQKQKSNKRLQNSRKKNKEGLHEKLSRFLRVKVREFKNRTRRKSITVTRASFSYTSAYKKVSCVKKCYLSGRDIDIENPSSYSLDHIIPTSRGGKNTLSNMGVTNRDANSAKTNLLVDEFIQLCIDVCNHNGYLVKKKK